MLVKRGDMWKKGQAYLISAIILSAIIIGIAVTINYATATSSIDLNGLKKELQIESAKTIDYLINNGKSQAEMNNILGNFSQNYINSQKDKDLYFVYGTNESLVIKGRQSTAKAVFLEGRSITNVSGNFTGTTIPAPGENNINLIIDKDAYNLSLKSGENFDFVVMQETNGERYVVTG